MKAFCKKNIINVNNKKIFNHFDVIIYLFILIILLFTVVFVSINKEKNISNGFKVYLKGDLIFTFTYEDKKINYNTNFYEQVEVNLSDSTIKIYIDNLKTEYNIISFDCENKSVKIIDSTCSISKDCTYFLPITTKSGVIYCKPHDLKILPLDSNGTITPTIG